MDDERERVSHILAELNELTARTGPFAGAGDPTLRGLAEATMKAAEEGKTKLAKSLLAETAAVAGREAGEKLDKLDPETLAEIRRRYRETEQQDGARGGASQAFAYGTGMLDHAVNPKHGRWMPGGTEPRDISREDLALGVRAAAHMKCKSSAEHASGLGKTMGKNRHSPETETYPMKTVSLCGVMARNIAEAVLTKRALEQFLQAMGETGEQDPARREREARCMGNAHWLARAAALTGLLEVPEGTDTQ